MLIYLGLYYDESIFLLHGVALKYTKLFLILFPLLLVTCSTNDIINFVTNVHEVEINVTNFGSHSFDLESDDEYETAEIDVEPKNASGSYINTPPLEYSYSPHYNYVGDDYVEISIHRENEDGTIEHNVRTYKITYHVSEAFK